MKRTANYRFCGYGIRLLFIVLMAFCFTSCDMFSTKSPFQSIPGWLQGTWESSSGETWKFDGNRIYHNGSDFGKELGDNYISSSSGYTSGLYQWEKFFDIYYAVKGGRIELEFNRDGAARIRLVESASYRDEDDVTILYRAEGPSIDQTIEIDQPLPSAFDFSESLQGTWKDQGDGCMVISPDRILIDNIGADFDITASTATSCPEFFSFSASETAFSLTFADPSKRGAPVYRLYGQLENNNSAMYLELWTISSSSMICWYYKDLTRQ